MDAQKAAEQFVALIMNQTDWRNAKSLSETDLKIVFDTVSMAGFNPRAIKFGKVIGYGDVKKDGKITGIVREHPINDFCFLKVIREGGYDDYPATKWLDDLVRNTWSWWKDLKHPRNTLIGLILQEINRTNASRDGTQE